MSAAYLAAEQELIAGHAKQSDIIISTALIPGKPAPQLITENAVKGMKRGSVIVDMAAEQGGNCPLTERDTVVVKHGVKLVGYSNLPAMLAADASALYARNVLAFVNLLIDPKTGALNINRSDEIIAGALVTMNGRVEITNH
jgi:NAD(P) transhydrogenase subunit alpha